MVKDYLVGHKILITLCLTKDIDDENAEETVIKRNFLSKKEIIRKINGKDYTEEEFEPKLSKLFFPDHNASKPTFRQIISHNIRYKDLSVNNTLKTLDPYTSDAEYETLHLFLFGCEITEGNNKQELLQKINQEDTFKKRLEKVQTKSAYETALSLIENEIEILNKKKTKLNINENFSKDLDELNKLKYKINMVSSNISKLNIRKEIILQAEKEISSATSKIDLHQLKMIYDQAKSNMNVIQKSFDDMVSFHNNMIVEKISYITKELPNLSGAIKSKKEDLDSLLKKEEQLSKIISKSDSFEELEELISELNEKYRSKGEYESVIQQLEGVEEKLQSFRTKLKAIDKEIFSNEYEVVVKSQLKKFNKHFSSVSNLLYDEQYAVKHDKVTNRKGQNLYKFSAFNVNFSTGKKQGEISCFDIAYTFFADEEEMPCMHFLLNDKKELMHDNQLVKIAELVNKSKIQFVASILKDKLPDALNDETYFVLKLSEKDKLFRIESGAKT